MLNRQPERRLDDRSRATLPEMLRIHLGKTRQGTWLTARLIDSCHSGLGIEVGTPLPVGAELLIQGNLPSGEGSTVNERRAKVAWCLARTDGSFRAGVHLDAPCSDDSTSTRPHNSKSEDAGELAVDHYEVLMLSANADPVTIHRVYRMLAQRYHPDNPDSGDATEFRRLLESYRVLKDPEQRAAFDARRLSRRQARFHILADPSRVGSAGSEKHKRQMILSLLYRQRTQDPDHPYLTVRELEDLLGHPRDHLQVSLWFLKEKNYLTRSDNGLYTITADGFEHAEEQGLAEFGDRKMLTAN